MFRDWRPSDPPLIASKGIKKIYADYETNGVDRMKSVPVGIAVKVPGEPSGYYPWAHQGGGNLCPEAMKRWHQHELRDVEVVNLNTKFEVHMSANNGTDLREQGCRFRDVAHHAALLDDHWRDFSLDGIAEKWLGRGKVKKEGGFRIEGKDIWKYPAGMVAPYACTDVDLVEDLDAVMQLELEDEDLIRVADLESDVIPVAVEMERNGAPLDVEKLERWRAEAEEERQDLLYKLYKATGMQINPDSGPDMVKLFKKAGLQDEWGYTAKGAPSFTDVVMRAAAAKSPLVADARQAGKLADLLSKYLNKYGEAVGDDGVLRYNLYQLMTGEGGTVSGRFASAAVNIQQVMANEKQIREYGSDKYLIRRLFVPGKGAAGWLSVDASQIEYRLFAHYAKDPAIMAVYRAAPRQEEFGGKMVWVSGPLADFHIVVMKLLQRVRPDFDRKRVKNVNFAMLFGAGIAKIAEMLECTEQQAREFREIYFRMFPSVRPLINTAMKKAETVGVIKTLLGRRSRFIDGERAHKALNAAIQGSAADLNKLMLVELYKNRKQLEVLMRFTVHDSSENDYYNPDKLPQIQEMFNQQLHETRVPILWQMEAGPNWGDVKVVPGMPVYQAAA
jgi:DNA polymerase I-like protein with 3'-5' exonuclease and polymerase domains